MDRHEIYQLIEAARTALKPTHIYAKSIEVKVTPDAHEQYMKIAKRILGTNISNNNLIIPIHAASVIETVRSARTKSTLRKYARAVRYATSKLLESLLKLIDKSQRAGDWLEVEKLVSSPMMTSLTKLAQMMPAEYGANWEAERRRKGKKSSLLRLPEDWREMMAKKSTGQYRIPMIVALLSGCRPAELEKGVFLEKVGDAVYANIRGAKVTDYAGQEYRKFRLADHPLILELIGIMESNGQSKMLVKVDKGNSVTTHMREVGRKIWPRRKESITVYTARHAMAADCKAAIAKGADPDLVSQVLGHIVDKTATYYGNRFQSGGTSVVPSEIKVPKDIRHKQRPRSESRMSDGKIPGQKNKSKPRFKP